MTAGKEDCLVAMRAVKTVAWREPHSVVQTAKKKGRMKAEKMDWRDKSSVAMMASWTAASMDFDLVVKSGDQKVEPKAERTAVMATNSVERKVGPSVGSRDER